MFFGFSIIFMSFEKFFTISIVLSLLQSFTIIISYFSFLLLKKSFTFFKVFSILFPSLYAGIIIEYFNSKDSLKGFNIISSSILNVHILFQK
jgi:hypothetical protein